MLMFLAFLIDQAQETCCLYFQKALQRAKRKIRLWEKLRAAFSILKWPSWEFLYEQISQGFSKVAFIADTS